MAKAGYIVYQNCKTIERGRLTNFINNLIKQKLSNADTEEMLLICEIRDLEREMGEIDDKIIASSSKLAEIRDQKVINDAKLSKMRKIPKI